MRDSSNAFTIFLIFLASSCRPESTITEIHNSELRISDVAGAWVLDYCNGGPSKHGMVILLNEDGTIESRDEDQQDDRFESYWHLLYSESGQTIFVRDDTWTDPDHLEPIVESFDSPVVVTIEAGIMVWKAFGREARGPAKPTDIVLFRFKRENPSGQ